MAKTTVKLKPLDFKAFWRKPATVRLAMFVVFVLATTLILPRSTVTQYEYEVGKEWKNETLEAPFDFPILKTESEYQKELATVEHEVPQVFLSQPMASIQSRVALQSYFADLKACMERWRQFQITNNPNLQAQFEQMAFNLKPAANPATLNKVFLNYRNLDFLERYSFILLDSIYASGYVSTKNEEEKSNLFSLRKSENIEKLTRRNRVLNYQRLELYLEEKTENIKNDGDLIVIQALLTHAQPNYLYRKDLYQQELAYAQQSVLRYKDKVKRGDQIVGHGQKVTPEIAQKIESLAAERQLSKNGSQADIYLKALGELMMVILLTIIVVMFLKLNRQSVYYHKLRLMLLFSIYFFITVIVVLAQELGQAVTGSLGVNFFFAVPLCMAAVMITVFFDDRIGYFSNILIALFAGIASQNSFEFFFIQTCAGSVAVFNLSVLRRRSQFFATAGALLLTYFVAYLGYNLYLKGSFSLINYTNLILFVVNVSITLGTYPLIYIFERTFGVTSDVTFMELLDTDHPLLKELAQKAPGTYQHSLQVANIAEEVAKRVGANALQVHVGALFHDVGKLSAPEFFTENQKIGFNPHDDLTPLESAKIIINHVTYGEELARLHKLPTEIVEFICTHHGASRVEYFYRKYQKLCSWEEGKEAEIESQFRYPGPLPTTKEMAILMIADSIEAASRSLTDPTPEQLENLIENIVSSKITDNQLIDAAITFRDVTIIKRSIYKLLVSIYHHRIKYPERVVRN